MRISRIIVALLVSVVAVTVMTSAVANPDGSISPTNIQLDVNTDAPQDVTFQWWDLTTTTVDEVKFYIFADSDNDGYPDDSDADSNTEGGNDADVVSEIAVSTDAGSSWDTTGLVTVSSPVGWDSTEVGEPSGNETRYTFTVKLKDANLGAVAGENFIIKGTAGTVNVQHGLSTTTDINVVPEFATIAIPAIAVLGLFLFFNKRKQKKD